MQESDTYLAIVDEGQEKALREAVLLFGEERFEDSANRLEPAGDREFKMPAVSWHSRRQLRLFRSQFFSQAGG